MTKILEIDAATGESILRSMTPQEEAQRAADVAVSFAIAEAAAADEALRISARQKIAEASGLTPDEMSVLGF